MVITNYISQTGDNYLKALECLVALHKACILEQIESQSNVLVVLMRDEHVYVMNVGDSKALVAQYEQAEHSSSSTIRQEDDWSNVEGIIEESLAAGPISNESVYDGIAQSLNLTALQLSTDHSTIIEELLYVFDN